VKAINLLIDSALPPDLRDPNRPLDKKSVEGLLAEVARRYPDQYADIAKHILDAGRHTAYLQGETIGLDDLKPVIDKQAMLAQMDAETDASDATATSPKDKKMKRVMIWSKYGDLMDKQTMAGAKDTALGRSVTSGARGNSTQLRSILTAPAIYTDYKGEPVPMFIRHSFAEGMRPAEYLASSFGTRSAIVSTKKGTALGGDACLHEFTLVRMADGSSKTIRDIRVGEWVLGSDKFGNTFPVQVKNVFDQGLKDVHQYRVAMSGNRELFDLVQCTPDHKFLTFRVSTRKSQSPIVQPLAELKHATVKLMTPCTYKQLTGKHESKAFLLGLLTGDGYLPSDKGKINLTCADSKLISDLAPLIEQEGLRLRQRTGANTIQYSITEPKADHTASSFKHCLDTYGMRGRTAAFKQLPKDIETWDITSIAAYIGGLFTSDGSVTHRTANGRKYASISFGSVSKDLIFGLRHLLRHFFCIETSVPFCTKKEALNRRKRQYAGFDIISNYDTWSILIGSMRDITQFSQTIPLMGVKADAIKQAMQLVTAYGSTKTRHVVDVGSIGLARCLDIEVDHPDHLFVLDCGVICSNSKQLVSAAAQLVVTEDDCGTGNGIDFKVDDSEIRGRVLARAEGKVPAGTVVDKHVMAELRKAGVKSVMARSPMTCTAKEGICAHCMGLLPTGHFPEKGYSAGITAAHAIGEPLAQQALSQKHTAGAFGGTKKQFAGFRTINQLLQTPETFPNKAALAEATGRVGNIEDAPQGGKYIHIGEHKHYILPDFEPLVKTGDEVEAGDPLSEGVADVADVIRLRGLGEGRKYYVNRVGQAMSESGYGTPQKLNLELLARASLDHVQIDDPEGMGNYLPDDTVSYSQMANNYVAPASAALMAPDKAVGKVLHAPAMHFTIGTRLTPKMVKQLNESQVQHVVASDEEPKFHPEMVRLRSAAHNNPDWFARLHSSYLTTGLEDAVTRAHDTDVESNTHFAPRLAIGQDFGKNVETTGKF